MSRRPGGALLFWSVVAGVMGAIAGAAAVAHARSAAVVPYASGDVWPATIRFLRVDHDYAIKEKDEPAGYVLFELPENKRLYRAALELVKTTDEEGRAATQIVCTMPELPRRYEAALLDKLTAKVRDERGPPPPAARKPTQDPKHEPKHEPKPEPRPEKPEPNPPGDLGDLPKPPVWGPPPR
jgi:hypothetical protein